MLLGTMEEQPALLKVHHSALINSDLVTRLEEFELWQGGVRVKSWLYSLLNLLQTLTFFIYEMITIISNIQGCKQIKLDDKCDRQCLAQSRAPSRF